ncbi:hypothetical protein C162_05159 [Paenibacillus sp. FSL R7-269]|nr:hypothetical protein C162_05159 [Paenibacillus sp. FSL R7-269]
MNKYSTPALCFFLEERVFFAQQLRLLKLNHFFISVDQPSTGAEYTIAGNISDQVISDIADWLNGVSAAKTQ